MYCAGSPVKFVDPDGRKFTEGSEEHVQKVVDYADRRITLLVGKNAEMQSKINNGVSSRRLARLSRKIKNNNSLISQYQEAKSEISVLRNSTQLYSVSLSDDLSKIDPNGLENEYRGATKFDVSSSTVNIVAPKSGGCTIGLLAHELKHAYQFETGAFNLGFGFSLYDIQDEVEAYYRGHLFGADNKSLMAINSQYYYLPKSEQRCISTSMPLPENRTHGALQNAADQRGAVFRYNGTTYVSKKLL